MPKIADIQETPNPNAVKFILREAVSYGTSHSFDSVEKAKDDKYNCHDYQHRFVVGRTSKRYKTKRRNHG